MENEFTPKTLENILKNPSEVVDLINNPRQHGLDFYNSLTRRQKQYLFFAAAAGLVLYGLWLNSEED